MKFNTHINKGLRSCLAKVWSRSVKNCRFWSTLKIVDLFFFQMLITLCRRVWSDGIEIELWNYIHVLTEVWGRASSRFHLDQLKIADSGALKKYQSLICGWVNVGDNMRYYQLNVSVRGPNWHILFQFCFFFISDHCFCKWEVCHELR